MEESRPRIVLPWTVVDKGVELIAALGAALLLLGALLSHRFLPERVPTHFGLQGTPDAWGHRMQLLAIAGIAFMLYLGLSLLSRIPHHYNYPWPITKENAPRQYLLARRLVIAIKAWGVWLFLGILIGTWRASLGASTGLTPWFLPLSLGILGTIFLCYFLVARRGR